MGTWSDREFYEWTEQECPEDDAPHTKSRNKFSTSQIPMSSKYV